LKTARRSDRWPKPILKDQELQITIYQLQIPHKHPLRVKQSSGNPLGNADQLALVVEHFYQRRAGQFG
jgi:hypothetical protein